MGAPKPEIKVIKIYATSKRNERVELPGGYNFLNHEAAMILREAGVEPEPYLEGLEPFETKWDKYTIGDGSPLIMKLAASIAKHAMDLYKIYEDNLCGGYKNIAKTIKDARTLEIMKTKQREFLVGKTQ